MRKVKKSQREFDMYKRYCNLEGFNDGCRRMCVVEVGSLSGFLEVSNATIARGDIRSILAAQGLPVSKQEEEEIRRTLSTVDTSAERICAHQPGWCASGFVLPDHTIVSTGDVPKITITFQAMRGRTRASGSHPDWLKKVAKPLAAHPLFVTGLSMVFAAALRPFCPELGSVLVEVVGRKGSGKSTLQQVMSSAMGPIGVGSDARYQTACEAFLADTTGAIARHAEMLMTLEDVDLTLVGEADASSTKQVKALLFSSAAKSSEVPSGFATMPHAKLFAFSSSLKSLADMAGAAPEVARVGAERLITLPIGWDRPSGVFESVADGGADLGEFAASLTRMASKYHGTAFPAFLAHLVSDVADNSAGVQKRVDAYKRCFRRLVDVDGSDGAAVRLAEMFALIYAGGRLAKAYGVLPKSFKIGVAVNTCYRMARSGAVQRQDFRSRLEELASDKGTVRIGKAAEALSPAERLRARVFLRVRPTGRELIVPPEFIEHVFPDWPQLWAREDVRATMIKDGDQWQPKRVLWKKVDGKRCFCFRLLPTVPTSASDEVKRALPRPRPSLAKKVQVKRPRLVGRTNKRRAMRS